MHSDTSNTPKGAVDSCPACEAQLLPSGFCHACELKKARENPPELTAVDLANIAHVRRYLARKGYINTDLPMLFVPRRRGSQRQDRAPRGELG